MHFQVVTTCLLKVPLVSEDAPGKSVVGYVTTFGVNAPSFSCAAETVESAMSSIVEAIVTEMQIGMIEKRDWPGEVLAVAKNIDQPGLYFRSGKAYFTDED